MSGQPTQPAQPVTALATWWLRFADAQLVALIDDALKANTTINTARAVLAQSRALSQGESARLLPGLNLSASARRSRAGDAGSANAFNAGFDASWEPDVFGGLHASVAASRADTLASAASLADSQISIAAEVALEYIQLRGLQARLAIAKENLASQAETLQLTEWRRDAGLLTELEVAQASASVEQTGAQIPLLQSAALLAEHSLAVLTYRAPGDLHDWLASGSGIPAAPDDLVLSFPADTLRQRPDVRAANARVRAARARVDVAEAARWPHFALDGSLGLGAAHIGELANASSLLASLLVSASASLFDGGAARSQVRAQQAALVQAEIAWNAALLNALKEVEDSLATLKNDRERLQSLLRADLAANQAVQLAQHRYRAGLIDFQILLDTQRTALSTQDSAAGARADLGADHVRLYKALGGGWDAHDQNRLAEGNAAFKREGNP
jgi:NodT family efflux transporter outer membrane factor (OMF) lipoprotein